MRIVVLRLCVGSRSRKMAEGRPAVTSRFAWMLPG